MSATLQNKKRQPAPEPASIEQVAKLIHLVAEQKPTMERVQQVMRLVPDLLKTDLGKLNRYDFCRHIGRELSFKVLSPEVELEIDYEKPYGPKLVDFYHRNIITKNWLDLLFAIIKDQVKFLPKLSGTATHKFFVVRCCNVEHLRHFDLQPGDLNELLAFEPKLNQIPPLPCLAGMCGSGWLWYSMDKAGVLDGVFDSPPGSRSYDEIFRYGNLNTPTLVRRVTK